MAQISFDGRVAIVTGAGGGLGKAYALQLAARGAKVVVNDLGGAPDGSGSGTSMADQVVEEIKKAGGEAVPNYDGVDTSDGGQAIVQTALDTWGQVDVLINNAGILRDVTLMKMTEGDFDRVVEVHLKGSYNVTKAVFPHMRERAYGRIVMTTSAAGLYGNFGQANYSAAKMGIVGLMNTLELEGAKYNVRTNTVAPIAASRLTETIMPPEVLEKLRPGMVVPMVLYLCSEECQVSGDIYSAGGGYFSRAAMVEGKGVCFDPKKDVSMEDVRDALGKIADMSQAREFPNAMDNAAIVLQNVSQ
jgi:NAD(P)-dependent dehydrogenase (short-subunit alcohol dehydrogenase family)